jgi:putative Mg2+ transporter-C (MgtC) family protein
MPTDVVHQLDIAVRIVVAALFGAAIGFEREIHRHPAGMRTHLLVSLGSALFTVISIFGFVGVLAPGQGSPVDPSRVAAQSPASASSAPARSSSSARPCAG